jgi:hypothetical protein
VLNRQVSGSNGLKELEVSSPGCRHAVHGQQALWQLQQEPLLYCMQAGTDAQKSYASESSCYAVGTAASIPCTAPC